MKASVLGGQICGSGCQARPAVDIDGLGEILVKRPLDHYLLADVAQRVGDRAGRYVAAEYVAHVLPGAAVPRHVSEIPAGIVKINCVVCIYGISQRWPIFGSGICSIFSCDKLPLSAR